MFLTVLQSDTEDGCTLTQGFWKNHEEAWPVSELALGAVLYTQAELLTLLDTPSQGDASLILAYQLIAARLNVAAGADESAISETLAASDAWLATFEGRLPYRVKTEEAPEAIAWADTLDRYNNGILPGGPPTGLLEEP